MALSLADRKGRELTGERHQPPSHRKDSQQTGRTYTRRGLGRGFVACSRALFFAVTPRTGSTTADEPSSVV